MPKLADFLESINFQNPLQPNNGLLQYANNTKLSTMEWLKANPKELELISNLLVAQTMNWRSSNRSALSSLFPPDYDSDVLVVDVGGGRGEALEDLRAHRPDLKGRMIFQDLPEVFAGRENIPGVTAMAHDFFTPQPIKGEQPLRVLRLYPYCFSLLLPFTRKEFEDGLLIPFNVEQAPVYTSSVTSCTTGRMKPIRVFSSTSSQLLTPSRAL